MTRAYPHGYGDGFVARIVIGASTSKRTGVMSSQRLRPLPHLQECKMLATGMIRDLSLSFPGHRMRQGCYADVPSSVICVYGEKV